ncbi:MAG: CHAT domain-containing protein [Candidatus Omnitrophota bacterium]|jgi:tetratricopeptide (TPR) repeat protein
MQEPDTLVLEILRQENQLSMSVFAQKEHISTVRHYSQRVVSFSEVDKLCREVTSILNKADRKISSDMDLTSSLKKSGQLLWDNLLTRSAKDKLNTAVSKDLILSLDEELINIPWELLYDGKDFLCLKFSLGRLVKTRGAIDPAQYRSAGSTLKMLVLANPTNDLRAAYLEGKYIKNQLERKTNKLKVDFKSTYIDALYVKKNLRDYDVVHFAGHSECDANNPEETGWILSDGKLTAGDILALGEGAALPNLIFSNACRSAVARENLMKGDYQEKAYSLASAFLFSGVRHYIGAIKRINDEASMLFAREFYTRLVNGDSVGECLRLARLKLIKEYGNATLLWTSYLLYGDPNFMFFRRRPALPLQKFKINIYSRRKMLAWVSLAVFIIAIGVYLYLALPTINPNTYFSFMKANRLYSKGRNKEVISLSENIAKSDPLFLANYPLLASAYERQGDRETALKYYFEYALNAQKRRDNKNLAAAYIRIAWIYQLSGEYPKAFDFYHKAIDLSQQTGDKLNESAAFERLAVWYIDKEEYDKALELLTKSSEINRERQHLSEHKYNLACDYFDIGLVFINKDDFAAAREFYRKSEQLFSQLKLKHELSDCYFNLGEICLFEKQYQKALDYYFRGLSIDQEQGHKPNLASDYDMIGELYLEMGNLEKAGEYFEQALLIGKEINALPELASVYRNLGILYKQKKDRAKSEEYLLKAKELYHSIDTPAYQKITEELSELTRRS